MESYIQDCIESIQQQTYYNLEILLIDDGSTDNSGKICDNFASKDKRIRVFHKKNGGLSDARNVGMDNCRGKYFCFVDSDDLLEKDYVQELYDLISSGEYQLAQVGTKIVSENNEKVLAERCISADIKLYNRDEFCEKLLLDKVQVAAWCNIYLHEAFKDVRFTKGRINEDFLMWSDGINVIDKIIISNKCLYRYRMRRGSITHSSRSLLYKACLENSKTWLEKISNNDIKVEKKGRLKKAAAYQYFYYLEMVAKLGDYKSSMAHEKHFLKVNKLNVSFLTNHYLTIKQKIYILSLVLNNSLLIYVFNKMSKNKD